MDAENKNIKLIKRKMAGVKKFNILSLAVPVWMPYLVIVLAAFSATGIFLYQSPNEFPITDAYIHLTYAKNLVKYHELTFYPGFQEGRSTTSVLWVVILALFQLVGVTPAISSKILGICLLACSGCLVFELVDKYLPGKANDTKILAAAITLFTITSGSMIWTALSGMETILFITLGLISLRLYAKDQWLSLGVVLGLMALTRIEGIILAGVFVLVEFINDRKITYKYIKIFVPIIVLLSSWLIYLQFKEGVPIMMSFVGRKIVFHETENYLSHENSFISSVMKINPLVHFFGWFYYLMFIITGFISFPGPYVSMTNSILGMQISLPIISIILIASILLPLFIKAFIYFWKKAQTLTFTNPKHRLLIATFAWFFLHNLTYALFLPRVGAGGRYALMNHIFLWICLFIGARSIINTKIRKFAFSLVLLLLGISLQYWIMVYVANVNYVLEVKQPALEFIEEHYPPDAPVGTTDLGHISFNSQRPVIDLLGHVNTDIAEFRESGGSFADYIFENKVCYLMLYDAVDGLGIDFSHEMKLYDDPRFYLVQDAEFSIPIEEWELGNTPLYNYMPAIKIYRVIWHDQASCW